MPHTKNEIANRLCGMAEEMEELAVDMDYYGGSAEWAKHFHELMGAAGMARQWAGEIEREGTGPQTKEES